MKLLNLLVSNSMNEDIHVGKLLEDLIRANGLTISDVARKIKVNRRSVYNWFKQKTLKSYTLQRICYVLVYDFSVKLPDFLNEEFLQHKTEIVPLTTTKTDTEEESEMNTVQYWMNKYIYLLEKYNEALAKEMSKQDKPTESKK